jgi:integrase/recombinase XerD
MFWVSPYMGKQAQQNGRDFRITKFRNSLVDQHYSHHAIKNYSIVAKRFLNFVDRRGTSLDSIQPDCVDAYLRLELHQYRRRHGRNPGTMSDWRWHFLSPIHKLLTLAQGQWPPLSAAEARVQWFRGELEAAEHSGATIRTYVRISRDFVGYLHRAGVDLNDAERSHVSAFIDRELRQYRKRHRRLPPRLVDWRCGLTSPIHLLLKKTLGTWPPFQPPHPKIRKLEEQLKEGDLDPRTRARHLYRARHFVSYLEEARGIAIEQVQPADIRAYHRKQLAAYRKKHEREPLNQQQWNASITAPVNRLLRMVFGVWPPGSEPDPKIQEFWQYLVAQGFSPRTIPSSLSNARCFLRYLKEHGKTLASVQPEDVSSYLKARLALYRRRNGRTPRNTAGWRYGEMGSIHRLLRLAQGQWPPARAAANELELWRRKLLGAYTAWMVDLRGLSQPTVRKNGHAARIFLEWLGNVARPEFSELTVPTIDRFLAWRNPKLRRATRSGVVHCLRDFLRFLHHKHYLERDFASAVPRVKLYRFEEVPKVFRPDQVKALLKHIYKDKTPIGLRDYAIVLLLARYGLRAGEIVRMRLEHIEWRREEFRVVQSKSHLPLRLPLSTEVGNAILRYLRRGRPHSKAREVFLRCRAPQGCFCSGSSLYSVIQRRLQQAGIHVEGRRGSHAFRYAHAGNLLRAQVAFKTIGDLLGHRSPASTGIYLKLATDDLRSVALEIPGGAR